MTFEEILAQPDDLAKLLGALDLTDETLNDAALGQSYLYQAAAKYYVKRIKETLILKARLSEREAFRAQEFRKAYAKVPKAKAPTDTKVKEFVILSKSVQVLKRQLAHATAHEEWARLLLESLKMRRDTIKVLSEVLRDESRSELRLMTEQRAKEELKKQQQVLNRKYPKEESV